jgi:hypothetical protein
MMAGPPYHAARTIARTARARWPLALILVCALWPVAGREAGAAADLLKPFFGAYVGVAEVEDLRTGAIEQRDMDIVIEPFRRSGFQILWVNVTLVDGRRDLPGVQRRVQTAMFEPAANAQFYVEVTPGSVFREREATRPMQGDPVRWAWVDGDRIHVCAFVVLDDGRYELQTYDRVLTERGIDILFERIVDGEVLRRIRGSTARANLDDEQSED